jgi:hypothetical protein
MQFIRDEIELGAREKANPAGFSSGKLTVAQDSSLNGERAPRPICRGE